MDKNTQNEREKQLEDLINFTESTTKELTQIVSSFGWTLDSISNDAQNIVICPFDRAHRIPGKSLEKHLAVCQWKAEGYGKDDIPLSESTLPTNSPSTVKFDEQLQDEVLRKAKELNPAMRSDSYQCCTWHGLIISFTAGVGDRLIPRTSDRLIADFTSDERRAIYDYVIANTVKPDIGDDIADMNKSKSNDGDLPRMSFLELLAKERNLKRRRAKHRGVHTNKKSQVEILREVINQQMEMYVEYMTDSSIKQEPASPGRSEANSTDFRLNDLDNSRQSSRLERYQTDSAERQSGRESDRYDRDSSRKKIVSDDFHSRHQTPSLSGRFENDLIDRKCTTNDSYCDWDARGERQKSKEREKRSRHSGRRRDNSRETILSEGRRNRRRSRDGKTPDKDKHRSRERHDSKRKHRSRDRNRSRHKKHHSRKRDRSEEDRNDVNDDEPRRRKKSRERRRNS